MCGLWTGSDGGMGTSAGIDWGESLGAVFRAIIRKLHAWGKTNARTTRYGRLRTVYMNVHTTMPLTTDSLATSLDELVVKERLFTPYRKYDPDLPLLFHHRTSYPILACSLHDMAQLNSDIYRLIVDIITPTAKTPLDDRIIQQDCLAKMSRASKVS